MLNYFSSIDNRMQPGDCQCGTGRTYLVKYLMYVPVPRKLFFFLKNPQLKKRFVCQCGTGRNYFHWSNLFSLTKSILTGQTYLVNYMVYVPVPQNLFFSKNSSEKAFVCQYGSGRIYFH